MPFPLLTLFHTSNPSSLFPTLNTVPLALTRVPTRNPYPFSNIKTDNVWTIFIVLYY